MNPSKAAIVTGGSSGIGFALASMLADEGYAVTIAARGDADCQAAVQTLRAEGAEVQALSVNVARPGALEGVISAHSEAYGRLDVLINNAGIATEAPIGDMLDSRIDLQIDVNLRAVITAYRAALPMLRKAAAEHRNALVINTASISAKIPQANLSIYATTKAALIGFTHAMNKELGVEGIKSTVLIPGIVNTPLVEYMQETVAAADMIQPSDIAEMVRALLRLGPSCVVAELEFQRPGGTAW